VNNKQQKKKNIERKREEEKEIKILLWKNEDKGSRQNLSSNSGKMIPNF